MIEIIELSGDYIRIITRLFQAYHARSIDSDDTLQEIRLMQIDIRAPAAADRVIETDTKECPWNG